MYKSWFIWGNNIGRARFFLDTQYRLVENMKAFLLQVYAIYRNS